MVQCRCTTGTRRQMIFCLGWVKTLIAMWAVLEVPSFNWVILTNYQQMTQDEKYMEVRTTSRTVSGDWWSYSYFNLMQLIDLADLLLCMDSKWGTTIITNCIQLQWFNLGNTSDIQGNLWDRLIHQPHPPGSAKLAHGELIPASRWVNVQSVQVTLVEASSLRVGCNVVEKYQLECIIIENYGHTDYRHF